jgi:hypothetical protein
MSPSRRSGRHFAIQKATNLSHCYCRANRVWCVLSAHWEGLLNRVILLLMALSLGACAAPRSQTNSLQSGMSKAQVVSILGEPDSSRLRNGDDCLMYSLWRDFWNRTPGNYSDRYYTCFTAGKLSSYGRVGDTF